MTIDATDLITIMGEVAAMNPVVMGTHNEPVCYFCGVTIFRGLPPAHRETCAWQRANAILDASRCVGPGPTGAEITT